LQIEALTPGFDITWEGKQYLATDLIFKTALVRSLEGLWLGKSSLGIQTAQIVNNQQKIVDVQAVALNSISEIKAGMLEGSGSINIQQFKEGNKPYGPMNLDLSVKNIDPNVVKAMLDNSKKRLVGSDPQILTLGQMVGTLVPQLLKTRPQFNVDSLSVITPEGELTGSLHFAIGGPSAFELNDMSKIIQSVAGAFSLFIPKTLLREILTYQQVEKTRAPNTMVSTQVTDLQTIARIKQDVEVNINNLLKDGILVEKENNYVVETSVQEGIFTINGKKMGAPGMPVAPGAAEIPTIPH